MRLGLRPRWPERDRQAALTWDALGDAWHGRGHRRDDTRTGDKGLRDGGGRDSDTSSFPVGLRPSPPAMGVLEPAAGPEMSTSGFA